MPRTFGNTFMHISEFDAIVECSHALPELIPEQATDEQRPIARNVADVDRRWRLPAGRHRRRFPTRFCRT